MRKVATPSARRTSASASRYPRSPSAARSRSASSWRSQTVFFLPTRALIEAEQRGLVERRVAGEPHGGQPDAPVRRRRLPVRTAELEALAHAVLEGVGAVVLRAQRDVLAGAALEQDEARLGLLQAERVHEVDPRGEALAEREARAQLALALAGHELRLQRDLVEAQLAQPAREAAEHHRRRLAAHHRAQLAAVVVDAAGREQADDLALGQVPVRGELQVGPDERALEARGDLVVALLAVARALHERRGHDVDVGIPVAAIGEGAALDLERPLDVDLAGVLDDEVADRRRRVEVAAHHQRPGRLQVGDVVAHLHRVHRGHAQVERHAPQRRRAGGDGRRRRQALLEHDVEVVERALGRDVAREQEPLGTARERQVRVQAAAQTGRIGERHVAGGEGEARVREAVREARLAREREVAAAHLRRQARDAHDGPVEHDAAGQRAHGLRQQAHAGAAVLDGDGAVRLGRRERALDAQVRLGGAGESRRLHERRERAQVERAEQRSPRSAGARGRRWPAAAPSPRPRTRGSDPSGRARATSEAPNASTCTGRSCARSASAGTASSPWTSSIAANPPDTLSEPSRSPARRVSPPPCGKSSARRPRQAARMSAASPAATTVRSARADGSTAARGTSPSTTISPPATSTASPSATAASPARRIAPSAIENGGRPPPSTPASSKATVPVARGRSAVPVSWTCAWARPAAVQPSGTGRRSSSTSAVTSRSARGALDRSTVPTARARIPSPVSTSRSTPTVRSRQVRTAPSVASNARPPPGRAEPLDVRTGGGGGRPVERHLERDAAGQGAREGRARCQRSQSVERRVVEHQGAGDDGRRRRGDASPGFRVPLGRAQRPVHGAGVGVGRELEGADVDRLPGRPLDGDGRTTGERAGRTGRVDRDARAAVEVRREPREIHGGAAHGERRERAVSQRRVDGQRLAQAAERARDVHRVASGPDGRLERKRARAGKCQGADQLGVHDRRPGALRASAGVGAQRDAAGRAADGARPVERDAAAVGRDGTLGVDRHVERRLPLPSARVDPRADGERAARIAAEVEGARRAAGRARSRAGGREHPREIQVAPRRAASRDVAGERRLPVHGAPEQARVDARGRVGRCRRVVREGGRRRVDREATDDGAPSR